MQYYNCIMLSYTAKILQHTQFSIRQVTLHPHLRRLVDHGHAELRALHAWVARTIQCGEQDVRAVDTVRLRTVPGASAADLGGGGVQRVQLVALGICVLDGAQQLLQGSVSNEVRDISG